MLANFLLSFPISPKSCVPLTHDLLEVWHLLAFGCNFISGRPIPCNTLFEPFLDLLMVCVLTHGGHQLGLPKRYLVALVNLP